MWVCQGGIHIPDAELLAEVFEEVGIELSTVVLDESSWDPKSCDDVLLHKVPRILLGDGGQRFGLVPLGEIIVATSYSLEFGVADRRCPDPTERKATGWIEGLGPALADGESVRISGTFLHFLA